MDTAPYTLRGGEERKRKERREKERSRAARRREIRAIIEELIPKPVTSQKKVQTCTTLISLHGKLRETSASFSPVH